MKYLFIIFFLILITSCASTTSKTLSQDDQRVQQHELFDGEIDSADITKEKVASSKSGTRFDKTDTDGLTEQQISQLKKSEHIASGDEALQAGNVDFALYSYVLALVEDNQDKKLYFKIGSLHESRGNTSLAGLAYKKALAIDNGYVDALERMGRLRLNDRDYPTARKHFKKAVSEDNKRTKNMPADASSPYHAYTGLGVMDDLEKNHTSAIDNFLNAILVRPDFAAAENNLGYSYYLNNDLETAETHFKKAIIKDKGYSKAWTNLALVYVRQDKFINAINLLIDHTDDKPSAYNTVGYICMIEGKYDQAEQFFNQAIDLSPTYFEIAVENRDLNRRRYTQSVYEVLN